MNKNGPVFLPKEENFLAPTIVEDLIRIGNKNDGGYVIPKSVLSEMDCLISMGISNDWSFEEHLLSCNPNIKIHAYDHTISSYLFRRNLRFSIIRFIVGKATLCEVLQELKLLRAYKKFFVGNVTHFEQRIRNREDNIFDVDIGKVFERTDSTKIFLKIDIEGSEYRIIDQIVARSAQIIGMVIEFHDTEPLRIVFNNAIRKLQSVFEIVHVHPNNYEAISADGLPEALELSFLRKEMCFGKDKRIDFPILGLDQPNDPTKEDYKMRFAL